MNLLDNRETVRVNHYTAYFFLRISGSNCTCDFAGAPAVK